MNNIVIIMKNFLVLLKTSRPIGWITAPLVFLAGLSYSGADLSFLPILQMLLLSFPYCLFLYGINDVYDYESDKLNPRKKFIEGVKLKPIHHPLIKKVSSYMIGLLVLGSLLTLNVYNFLGMFLLLFFSYFYSAPPIRLKEKPPLDSFSNGILYFFAPFLLGFSFGSSFLNLTVEIYLITVCVMGIHSFSTIMDYSTDKKVGDKTFAVVFGKRSAALSSLVLFMLAIFFAKVRALFKFYFIICSLFFIIIFIFPTEKVAGLFLKLIFLGFIAVAVIFLV